MSEPMLPPAIDGVEMRLDALSRRLDKVIELLTPKEKPKPKDGDSVELREPKVAPRSTPERKTLKESLPKTIDTSKRSKARSI